MDDKRIARYLPIDLWQDEDFGTVTREARLLFLGLVTFVDNQGFIKRNLEEIDRVIFSKDRLYGQMEGLGEDLFALSSANLITMRPHFLKVNNWWRFIVPNSDDHLRIEINRRDKYTCVYCGGPSEHLDHVYPRSKGGPGTTSNLVTACQECNLSKKAKGWRRWFRSQPFYSAERELYIKETILGYVS